MQLDFVTMPNTFLQPQQSLAVTTVITIPVTEMKTAVMLTPVLESNLSEPRLRRNAIYHR